MSTKYTRAAPSPRYRRLLEQYQTMHLHGETRLGIPPEQTFPGASLPKEAPRIKRLIVQTGATTLLDYGSGKGQQYWPRRMADAAEGVEYPDIKSYWGVSDVRCYDPAYAPFSELPAGTFDGEQIAGASRTNAAARYEFRLLYLKGGELRERFVSTERIESSSPNHSSA